MPECRRGGPHAWLELRGPVVQSLCQKGGEVEFGKMADRTEPAASGIELPVFGPGASFPMQGSGTGPGTKDGSEDARRAAAWDAGLAAGTARWCGRAARGEV